MSFGSHSPSSSSALSRSISPLSICIILNLNELNFYYHLAAKAKQLISGSISSVILCVHITLCHTPSVATLLHEYERAQANAHMLDDYLSRPVLCDAPEIRGVSFVQTWIHVMREFPPPAACWRKENIWILVVYPRCEDVKQLWFDSTPTVNRPRVPLIFPRRMMGSRVAADPTYGWISHISIQDRRERLYQRTQIPALKQNRKQIHKHILYVSGPALYLTISLDSLHQTVIIISCVCALGFRLWTVK